GASPLTLSIEEPQWDSESFTALATIRNTTGNYAGGLRLEFLEVTEGSRRRTISLDSPLFFGDLESGGEASLPFRLDGLGLSGEAPLVLLRGIVTGAVASASVELPDSADPAAIDASAGGALYVGDDSGKAIFRITADLGSIRRFDAGCPVTGLAVRRKSGEVLASCREAAALVRLAPSGKLTRSDPLDRPLGRIRFGGKDDLHGAPGTIVRLEGLSVAEEFGRGSPAPPRPSGFDVTPDGTVWAVTPDPEGRLIRIRSARDIVPLAGTGDGLGAIHGPVTCRVGPDGLVYVLEAPGSPRPPRVSVFDRGGGLVRAWVLPAGPPLGLTFPGDGRIAILARREKGSAVSVFRTF